MKLIVTRKRMIKEFATKIAELQKSADNWYYNLHDQGQSSWLIDQVTPLKEICQKLGIAKQVYEEAYKIYDFRNSGKAGYTLKSGRIVKEQ
jgi:transcription initiation factor TFIIIB Brf1 subunit/transcription initiation factor TFIIB